MTAVMANESPSAGPLDHGSPITEQQFPIVLDLTTDSEILESHSQSDQPVHVKTEPVERMIMETLPESLTEIPEASHQGIGSRGPLEPQAVDIKEEVGDDGEPLISLISNEPIVVEDDDGELPSQAQDDTSFEKDQQTESTPSRAHGPDHTDVVDLEGNQIVAHNGTSTPDTSPRPHQNPPSLSLVETSGTTSVPQAGDVLVMDESPATPPRPSSEASLGTITSIPPKTPQFTPVQRLFKKPKDRAEENQRIFEKMRMKRAEQAQKAGSNTDQPPSIYTSHGSNDAASNAVRSPEESWELEEIDHGNAAKQFGILKRNYEKRKAGGRTTIEEDIAFSKAEAQDKLRLKRLASTRAFEDYEARGQDDLPEAQDSLFVSEVSENEHSQPLRKRPALTDTQHDEPEQPKKRGKTEKPDWGLAGHVPINAIRDSHKIGRDFQEQSANKKRGRKPAGAEDQTRDPPNGKTRQKSTKFGKGKKQDDATSKVVKKRASKPKKGPIMSNVHSLLTSNLITDARSGSGNANALRQPGFGTATGRDRGKALQQLLASIPEEDRKTSGASADKNALVRACQSFNSRRMKPDGKAGWKLKGMETSLYHYQLLGAAFMRDRENGNDRPHGGLLCDEMGFGKVGMSNPWNEQVLTKALDSHDVSEYRGRLPGTERQVSQYPYRCLARSLHTVDERDQQACYA